MKGRTVFWTIVLIIVLVVSGPVAFARGGHGRHGGGHVGGHGHFGGGHADHFGLGIGIGLGYPWWHYRPYGYYPYNRYYGYGYCYGPQIRTYYLC